MNTKTISFFILLSIYSSSASALSINFIEDTPMALNFEMSNLGPTPGDQNILSPSGTWGIFAFVHQFDPGDEFAEIGAFVKKLLPVSEAIGTDVIQPQTRGLAEFPFSENAIGEFGDMYTGSFKLLPGSGMDAQEWDWVMTVKTATAANPTIGVPDFSTTWMLFLIALIPMLVKSRNLRRL